MFGKLTTIMRHKKLSPIFAVISAWVSLLIAPIFTSRIDLYFIHKAYSADIDALGRMDYLKILVPILVCGTYMVATIVVYLSLCFLAIYTEREGSGKHRVSAGPDENTDASPPHDNGE